ncbi:MAG: tRNA (adenosine(37)-N6)-dimethylallyltransferase MiaA [Gammaproteobacteria bacterium]|nr:tRNA (adenosine(37)-N6)-dimethylallyltransferase MiaA [Gammaproteobacteria bacterium]MBL6819504.1 tRNA (adenosine(37)-N6)-dimethylallyltransferase MiaA [Gammaproteobacteria bacterium]MBL6898873.1 tRNA (adenosine(37)-N6)-dimethylallyltransferase MiaA [Gammaproteobacteria bacterium]
MNNIFILLGPTASGKSRLSQKLADEFSFEIINADLYSIYKGLDIGTAKPSKKALIKNKHHLINKLEPTDEYNVSKYCHDVNKCINEITSLNKIPLITGGSMMYVYQLLNGLTHQYSTCDTDLKIIKYILKEYTNKQIIDAIRKYDHSLIKTLNKNDTYRIEKLLERLISSDSSFSKINGLYENTTFNITIIFINIKNRDILRNNIHKRTLDMIDDGLINEVKNLKYSFKLTHNHQSMRAIGYKETLQYLNHEITLKELINIITLSTQQLAKRQITWMNKFKIDFHYSYPDDEYEKLSDYVRYLLN